MTEQTEQAWKRTQALFPKGIIVEGRVEQLYEFGALLSIPGTVFPGIIVITSISDTKQPLSIEDFPPIGTDVRAVVIGHRDAGHQIALSLRDSDFQRFDQIARQG